MTPPNRRIKFPLVVKLIGIISVIVLVSMIVVSALVTWFFANDIRSQTEEYNLSLSQSAAFQMESEIRSIQSASLSLLDTLRESGGNRAFEQVAVSNFWDRNATVAYVGVPDARTVFNRKFFAAYEIEQGVVAPFLAARADVLERAKAGESLLVNASPWLGVSSAALVAPCRDFGTDNVLVVIFSIDNLLSLVQGDSVNRVFAVANDGEVLVHSDAELVKLGANLRDSPIVAESITNPSDNLLFRFRDTDKKNYLGAYRKVSIGQFEVISTIQIDAAYEAVFDTVRRNLYLTGIVILFSILAVWFFSKTVSRPVLALVAASRRIEAGEYELDIVPTTRDEVGLLTESFAQMGRGLAERERIKDTFGKFVNKEIAERALTGNLQLGGTRKTATIFFSDIRSFTAISEKLAPEAVVEFLNEYMTRMVDCIEKTDGVVDKFIGDAIMAVWGAPVSLGSPEQDALACVNAMLMMRSALIDFNKGRGTADKPVIRIGCGVNTGPCLAGQIGSANRMEYTVIGDAVNLASRIEALNKPFGTDILISENTLALVRDKVIVEPMSPIKVKGKADPLQIFAVVNLVGASGPKTLAEVRSLLGITAPSGIVDTDQEEVKYEIIKE
jgi:adenylate cyclase